MIKYKQFLLILTEAVSDNRIKQTKNKFKSISTSHDPDAIHTNSDDIVQHFADNADPSDKKEHLQWIMNQYKKGNVKQEDDQDIHKTLTNFRTYQKKLGEKDLNRYKHVDDVKKALEPHVGTDASYKAIVPHPDAPLIHKHGEHEVHELNSTDASRHYFRGGSVCTARNDEHCQHDNYSRDGQLYHVKARGENGKFKDYNLFLSNDTDIRGHELADKENKHEEFKDFIKRNPELKNVDKWQGKTTALTSDENFDKHFDNLRKNDLEGLLNNERLQDHHLTHLMKDDDFNVREAVANNPKAQDHHLTHLMQDDNLFVRTAVANNPNAQEHHLTHLMKDDDYDVRKAVADHPKAQAHHLTHLMKDDDPYVKYEVAKSEKAQEHHLTHLMNDDVSYVRSAVAKSEKAQEHHLTHLMKDDHYAVRTAVANNPNAQEHHLTHLMQDKKSSSVRWAVAKHPKAQEYHLTHLMKDDDYDVRKAVADHPKAQEHHLTHLIRDTSATVREAAQKALKVLNKTNLRNES